MPTVNTQGRLRTYVTAEHREGVCEKCQTPVVKEFYMDGERKRVRMVCPKCGGMGRLIAKTYSVQPPDPPKCVSFKCLYKFVMGVLFCALLSDYHKRRVAYATKNRRKEIPERYRTGEKSPKTIWQAIYGSIKLFRG